MPFKVALAGILVLAPSFSALQVAEPQNSSAEISALQVAAPTNSTDEVIELVSNATANLLAKPKKPELIIPKLLKPKGLNSTKFRTETCDSFSQKETMEDGKVMDQIKVDEPSDKPRIACLMYSHSGARQKQRDSFATWGQDCDEFLAFSDEKWKDKESGFETIEVHPPKKNEKDLIGKLRAAYKEVLKKESSKRISFDFLAVSGDDAFWVIPNLKHQLSKDQRVQKLSKEGTGLVYGHIFAQDGNTGAAFPSGAGYVLDKIAIQKYLEKDVQDAGWWEDASLGRVMMEKGVPMLHAQEEKGAHLMHPFAPSTMLATDYKNDGGWFGKYEGPFTENLNGKNGQSAISRHSFLFHYTEGQQKYTMHDRLHFARACTDPEQDKLKKGVFANEEVLKHAFE